MDTATAQTNDLIAIAAIPPRKTMQQQLATANAIFELLQRVKRRDVGFGKLELLMRLNMTESNIRKMLRLHRHQDLLTAQEVKESTLDTALQLIVQRT